MPLGFAISAGCRRWGLIPGFLVLATGLCYPVRAEVVAVTSIINGNSFEADGDRNALTVHLVGVEVPRLATTRESELAATAATKFLACLINRKAVDIERVVIAGAERAVYAHVSLGELSVNEAVLRSGFGEVASDYTAAPADRFREIEQAAKRERRGVWNPSGVPKEISCARSVTPAANSMAGSPKSLDAEIDTAGDRARARADRMLRRFDEKRWTILFSTGEGIFGFDAKLTAPEGEGKYLTWLRLDYVEAQPLGDDEYHYSLERVRVDCPKSLVQMLSTVKYNHQADDSMKVVFSWTPAPVEQKWEPVVPESFGEKLYGELCKVLTARFERTATKNRK